MMAPATLLVPLDGSTNATAALSVARGLAHLKGATVVLIHVGREALAPDELLARMRLSAEDVRGLVIDQCTGSPADAIVREAAARHTVLIVMCGPARPDGPLHAFGSVLGDVLRTAPCPVVLVPSIRGRHPWALRRIRLGRWPVASLCSDVHPRSRRHGDCLPGRRAGRREGPQQ